MLPPELADVICCPECKGALGPSDGGPSNSNPTPSAFREPVAAWLGCGCGRRFPITHDGIPCLWSDKLREAYSDRTLAPNREAATELDVKTANVRLYNDVSEDYESKRIHADQRTRQRLQAALDSNPVPGWHLDMGTGPGNVLDMSDATRYTHKLGCDVSLSGLRIVKGKGYNAVLADAERLCFQPARFALVTCCSVLHHFFSPAEAIAEMARVVQPGGLMVTDFDPNRDACRYGPLAQWLFNHRDLIRKIIHKRRSSGAGSFHELLAEFHNGPGRGLSIDELTAHLRRAGIDGDIRTHSTDKLRCFVVNVLSFRNPWSSRNFDTIMTIGHKTA